MQVAKNNVNIYPILYFLIFSIIFSNCSEQSNQNNQSLLPKAAGDITELLIVIDSTKWSGPIGQFFKESLGAPIPGLPQDEPLFTIRRINPLKMNNVLKTAKSIIYVTVLDDQSQSGRFMVSNIAPESIERIKNEPELFMFTKQDEYAIGQEITHLFGATEDMLLQNLIKNRERLINYFVQKAHDRMLVKLYSAGEEKNLSKSIEENHQFSIRMPFGYKIADEKENFVWIRQLDPQVDKSIFIYYTEYTSEEVFQRENLLKLRESITSKYLRDIQKPNLYITYQDIFPMKSEVTTFHQKYAVKSIGLWRVSDNSLGGPYKSYAFVDEKLNRLYYMEGFITAPGKDKGEPLMELEVIMSTFGSKPQLEDDNNS